MAKKTDVKPAAGEVSGPQKPSGRSGVVNLLGDDKRPDPGTYATYRRMMNNPTVSLAVEIATAPIRTSEWTLEADDDREEEKEFIEGQLTRHWPRLIRKACYALRYGFQTFEMVWAVKPVDGAQRTVIDQFKFLIPDITTHLIDKETGAWAGVKNADKPFKPNKILRYTHDGEGSDYYGRSRHENIRETAWSEWNALAKKRAKYAKRVAGAVPLVEYPDGESQDASGATVPNYQAARNVVKGLEECDGVYMPNVLASYAGDLARAGIDPSKLRAWHIDFLESKAAHGGEITDMMKHDEQLFMRGWLVPERSGIEATTGGSRADSETHADVGLLIAGMTLQEIVEEVQAGFIDLSLDMNYGEDARGTVRMVRAGLAPELVAFYRQLMNAVLGNAANLEVLLETVDWSALADAVGLPRRKETPIDQDALIESVKSRSSASVPGVPGEPKEPTGDKKAADLIGGVTEMYRRHWKALGPEEARVPKGEEGGGQWTSGNHAPVSPEMADKHGKKAKELLDVGASPECGAVQYHQKAAVAYQTGKAEDHMKAAEEANRHGFYEGELLHKHLADVAGLPKSEGEDVESQKRFNQLRPEFVVEPAKPDSPGKLHLSPEFLKRFK